MEWTPRPAPCPSSPPLWDWDATAGEEEREAKRGSSIRGGGGAVPGGRVRGGAGRRQGYHRKHRVCEAHSKCPLVVVAGQERRFCQQCSRFHALSEFDQKKRSCRRRLSDHNARRRKPQPDAFSFGSAVLPSSLLDDRREISFVWNKASLSHVKPFSCSSWPSDFKLSQVSGVGEKSIKAGAVNGQIHLSKSNLSNSFPTLCHDIHELLPIKGAGAYASGAASKLDGAPDTRRALSLLSASSWGSTDPVQQTSSLIQFTDANQNGMVSPVSNRGNSNSPFWIDGQPPAHESQVVQFTIDTGSTALQDLERIKPAYESALFSMNQIH